MRPYNQSQYDEAVLYTTFPSAEDLTGNVGRALALNGEGRVRLANEGDLLVGFLMAEPGGGEREDVTVLYDAAKHSAVAGGMIGAGEAVKLGDQGMMVEVESGDSGFIYGVACTSQPTAGRTFQVAPLRSGSYIGISGTETPTSPPGTLDPPTGLAAGAATASTIPLTWDPVAGATGYQISYTPANEPERRVPATGTGHTLTGLEDSNTYTIRIRTLNAEGYGAWSPTIRKSTLSTLPAPTGFALGTATGTTLPLTWNLRPGATSYDVGWKLGDGSETVLDAGNNDNLTITGLTPGHGIRRADTLGERRRGRQLGASTASSAPPWCR